MRPRHVPREIRRAIRRGYYRHAVPILHRAHESRAISEIREFSIREFSAWVMAPLRRAAAKREIVILRSECETIERRLTASEQERERLESERDVRNAAEDQSKWDRRSAANARTELERLARVNADLLGEASRNIRRLESVRLRYLDLLEAALTGLLYDDPPISPWSKGYDREVRLIGRDWPSNAQTMIGAQRMHNIRTLAEIVIRDDVKGDFLEAGVWRGGACIYMRGILAVHDVSDRKVWVADSFSGLPLPEPDAYPADVGDPHHTFKELIVTLEDVKANFARYGLLDHQVEFLPGWFKDTFPSAPIERLALLRLDGDMYQSTMETLEPLYPKVPPGGYVIIDDYILEPCRMAVHDFRAKYNILERIQDIDGAGVYWRKER